MSAIITEKFRQHNATQFHESFSESSGNTYYLTIGKSSPFTSATSGGSDDSPPTQLMMLQVSSTLGTLQLLLRKFHQQILLLQYLVEIGLLQARLICTSTM